MLSGFDEPPFGYGWEKGLPVEHKYWKNSADLERSLNDTLVRLAEDRIPFDDVVILSPRRLESSCLAECGKLGDLSVLDCSLEIGPASTPSIRFSTIYAFKGLESKVVIVVDVEEAQGNKWQSLMYVAMSRASSLLFLYVNVGFRAEFESRLKACSEWGLKFPKESGQVKIRKKISMAGYALGSMNSYTYGVGRLAIR